MYEHTYIQHELLGKGATGSHRPQDPHIGAVHSRGGGAGPMCVLDYQQNHEDNEDSPKQREP